MGAGASLDSTQLANATPSELRDFALQLPAPELESLRGAMQLISAAERNDALLRVEVVLPSGHQEVVSVPPGSTAAHLTVEAQKAPGIELLHLTNHDPRICPIKPITA